MSRGLACLMLTGMLAARASADASPEPAATGVCPLHAGATPSQIDVFDGLPSEEVILASDDDGAGANTYTVKDVYAQGRSVTIRCHCGQESIDIKIPQPVTVCRYSGDDRHAQMTCK